MFYNVQLKGVSILTRAASDQENEKTMKKIFSLVAVYNVGLQQFVI